MLANITLWSHTSSIYFGARDELNSVLRSGFTKREYALSAADSKYALSPVLARVVVAELLINCLQAELLIN